MLKSELVIPEDLNLLESHLKHYSIRFFGNIFSDDKGPDMGGYKGDRIKLLTLLSTNNYAEAKSLLVPQMLSDRDLFNRVSDIIWNKSKDIKWDIDIGIIANMLNQIEKLKDIIEKCFACDRLTIEIINEYYEESLVVLVYFNMVRSYIETIRNIGKRFQPNNTLCIIKFSHTEDSSFSIAQQKNIIIFMETVISCFFTDYMNIFSIDFDTGSPKLDCSIKINHESKTMWDISKSISDFFNYLIKGDKANCIRAFKKTSDLLYQDQKRELYFLKSIKNELTQEEYDKRIKTSFDSFSELRRNNIMVAIDNSRNNQIERTRVNVYKALEDKAPLQIEDPEPLLLPDKTELD